MTGLFVSQIRCEIKIQNDNCDKGTVVGAFAFFYHLPVDMYVYIHESMYIFMNVSVFILHVLSMFLS